MTASLPAKRFIQFQRTSWIIMNKYDWKPPNSKRAHTQFRPKSPRTRRNMKLPSISHPISSYHPITWIESNEQHHPSFWAENTSSSCPQLHQTSSDRLKKVLDRAHPNIPYIYAIRTTCVCVHATCVWNAMKNAVFVTVEPFPLVGFRIVVSRSLWRTSCAWIIVRFSCVFVAGTYWAC